MDIQEEIAAELREEMKHDPDFDPFYDYTEDSERYAAALTPLLNRVRAEAIRTWADFQDQAIKDIAYVADDADRAEVNRWTVSARAYADRIEQNSEGNET